jgi:hypothetical protein
VEEAVLVFESGNTSRSVRIILNVLNCSDCAWGKSVIDETVHLLDTTTAVTGSDSALVVSTSSAAANLYKASDWLLSRNV